jgi:LAS superfamily LD-carboxypeptidase LdcB
MASLRNIKKSKQSSFKKNYKLPKSKYGKVAGAIGSKSVAAPKDHPDHKQYQLPETIGNATRVDNQQRSNEIAVREIDRQLDNMASMLERQQDMIKLQDANQRNEDWLGSKPKFKTTGTVLFPNDLENIKKIVKQELREFAMQGGFGGGFGIPGFGGRPPAPVPGPGKPKSGPLGKAGAVLKSGAVGGAIGGVLTAGGVALEHMDSAAKLELAYRNGEITKDEWDAKTKELNYESSGAATGAVVGAIGLGALLTPIPGGSIVGGMAGAWLGEKAGRFIGKSAHNIMNNQKPIVDQAAKAISTTSAVTPQFNKQQINDAAQIKKVIDSVADKYEIDADEMMSVAMQESSLNPTARSGNSNAVGLFQFLPQTWDDLLKLNPDVARQYGIGRSAANGNDDRLDVQKSAIMYALLRKSNLNGVGANTTGNKSVDVYILHLLGASSGKKVIVAFNESPSDKITAHVSSAQYKSNEQLMSTNGKVSTVSEFVANVKQKLDNRLNEVRKKVEQSTAPTPITKDEAPSEMSKNANNEQQATKGDEKPLGDVAVIKQGVDTQNLTKAMQAAVTGLANDYEQATGSKLTINSAFRSSEQQARLYEQDPKMAAKPGTSLHEFGLAIDGNTPELNKADSMGLLADNGLERPIGSEKWHVSLKGARGNLRSNPGSEERSQMTASLSKPQPTQAVPIVIQQPMQQPTVTASQSNTAQVPLSTRNSESTYAAMRMRELVGIA